LRNLLVLAGLAVGLIGLGINARFVFPAQMTASATNPVAQSFLAAFVYFWTFFTHLTNLWLVLTYMAVLTRWRSLSLFAAPVAMASAAAFITLVLAFFHFMLAPTLNLTGWMLSASYMLHYVAPLLYLTFWVTCAPHGTLRWSSLVPMLLPGIVYVAWVLGRGAVVHDYPYDILDAGKAGYGGVAIGVLILLAAVSLFALLLIAFDRWRGRRPIAR